MTIPTIAELAARAIWPELYDDKSKGAFDRASTMTVEAARGRAEAEKRIRKMFAAIGASGRSDDALKNNREIINRTSELDRAAFFQICAAIAVTKA